MSKLAERIEFRSSSLALRKMFEVCLYAEGHESKLQFLLLLLLTIDGMVRNYNLLVKHRKIPSRSWYVGVWNIQRGKIPSLTTICGRHLSTGRALLPISSMAKALIRFA